MLNPLRPNGCREILFCTTQENEMLAIFFPHAKRKENGETWESTRKILFVVFDAHKMFNYFNGITFLLWNP